MSSSSPRCSNLNAPEQQGRESHKASSPRSPRSRKAVEFSPDIKQVSFIEEEITEVVHDSSSTLASEFSDLSESSDTVAPTSLDDDHDDLNQVAIDTRHYTRLNRGEYHPTQHPCILFRATLSLHMRIHGYPGRRHTYVFCRPPSPPNIPLVFEDPILSDLLRSTGWERIEDKLIEKRKYKLRWSIWLEAVGKAEVEEWEKVSSWKESITMQQLRGEDQCGMVSFLREVWKACEIRGPEDDGNYVAAVYIQ
ncbi:hypothetical protein BDZ91DRAFT_795197 [Kalaharituber pfeilii]|nr:hypothetical protein BDZ91DRAFT_795197 [Kalaharituber pfeilii]